MQDPKPADLAPLLSWYRRTKRDLPWRRTRDPYAIWVSETMLQQTRVDTVVPYYERFMRELPTVQALAESTEDRVLSLWSGLGYYRRARMLHAAARRVARDHGARVPRKADDLRSLEGVGAYTAGAVASIAFGERVPLVDGNVARVLARLFAIEDDVKAAAGNALVWSIATALVAKAPGDPGAWNQALMELGATVCTPRDPTCGACPVAAACVARARGVEGELPRVVPKGRAIRVYRVAIVLASGSPSGSVVLARRRRDALFGGLWEPPGADAGADGADGAIERLSSRLGVASRALRPAGEVVHVLSHRRLQIVVMRGSLGSRRGWSVPGPEYDAIERVPLARLASYAHATLTRKLLTAAEVATVAKPPRRGLGSRVT
jgi:A/G-specific adenine glycosylase